MLIRKIATSGFLLALSFTVNAYDVFPATGSFKVIYQGDVKDKKTGDVIGSTAKNFTFTVPNLIRSTLGVENDVAAPGEPNLVLGLAIDTTVECTPAELVVWNKAANGGAGGIVGEVATLEVCEGANIETDSNFLRGGSKTETHFVDGHFINDDDAEIQTGSKLSGGFGALSVLKVLQNDHGTLDDDSDDTYIPQSAKMSPVLGQGSYDDSHDGPTDFIIASGNLSASFATKLNASNVTTTIKVLP